MFLGQSVIISSEESQKFISFSEPYLKEAKLKNTTDHSSIDNKNTKRVSYIHGLKVLPEQLDIVFNKEGNGKTFWNTLSNSVKNYSNFLLKNDTPIRMDVLKYPTGGFLFKHDDTYHEGLRLVGVGNLNENYEGGLFKTDQGDLNKGAGNVAWFYPNLQHEVTKVTKGERWSIVIWLFNENLNIKKAVI